MFPRSKRWKKMFTVVVDRYRFSETICHFVSDIFNVSKMTHENCVGLSSIFFPMHFFFISTIPGDGNFHGDFPDRKHNRTLRTTQKRPAHSIENRISRHGELAEKSFNPFGELFSRGVFTGRGLSHPLFHSRKAPKVHGKDSLCRRGFCGKIEK